MAGKVNKISIPLRLISIDKEGFHLMVKVKLNGKIARMVLDTGASKTVFDNHKIRKYLKAEQFEKNDQLSTGLGTNSMESHSVVVKKMIIGELVVPDFKIILLDLTHISQSYAQMGLPPIDGVLGGDILYEFNAIIDYGKKIMHLKMGR